MATRLTACATLYHFLSSRAGSATTESFSLVTVSTLFLMRILLPSSFLNFSLNVLPSSVLASTCMRLVFLLWLTVRVVSGLSTISFSNAFLRLGSCCFFCASSFCFCLHSFTAVSASLPSLTACSRIAFSSVCCLALAWSRCLFSRCRWAALFCVFLSKRSLAFFRKGTML